MSRGRGGARCSDIDKAGRSSPGWGGRAPGGAGWLLTAALVAATWSGSLTAQSTEGAVRAFEEGRHEEAAAILEGLLGGPDEARARLYLGRIHFAREEWEEAEGHLERAVELEPGDAETRYWLARSYVEHIPDVGLLSRRGMAMKALETLRRTLEIDPDHVDARVTLAGYYLNAPGIVGGSKEKAWDEVGEITARDPKRGYLFQAELHEDAEDWDEALEAYTAALDVAPGDPQVLYQMGMFLQGREDWAGAVEHFERAARTRLTKENRAYVRGALYQVGRTGALSGQDLDRSITALLEFTRRFPEREDALAAGAHWRLGILYEMKGDLEAARASYRDALSIDPEQEEAREALRRLSG